MIRTNDLPEPDMEDDVESTTVNGSFPENCADKTDVDTTGDEPDPEKVETEIQVEKKVQGGYECKYCPFSTQKLNEFKEHVDASHPNVILNPLYLCAVCNFNTKKFDSLTEHNDKCHPGESNFKFKRIKQNSQTILEQTIEGLNCAAIYDATSPHSGEDLSPSRRSSKIGKPKAYSNQKHSLLDSQTENVNLELPKKQITALNVNGTVIIPEATLNEGLSHIMPSLQRPPNYTMVPKVAIPLNTSKYNSFLDGNVTLISSFNKFPYPTQAELSWLTAASKHPEEQIKVWFTTQRLKQGISWSPEEVEEARKKMFNGTIVQQAFTVLPTQLNQSSKIPQSLLQSVSCQVLGQSGLVFTPVANGSHRTSTSPALMVASQAVQAVKRPLMSPGVAPDLKRPSIIQTVSSACNSPTPLDCSKTPDQVKELTASYVCCQFPDDEEVYRLIETTGLSWGEIKKWFSDQRLGNHKPLKAEPPLKENQPLKTVATKFPLLERVKGKSSEQIKMLEECFQKTSFLSQKEIEHLALETRLSKTEIDGWFTERRALRDNLEQALFNSMSSRRLDRLALNGVQEQEVNNKPLTPSPGSEIDSKSLWLLKEVFLQTQWPSPEEYNQLEVQTGLPRTEVVRWFKNSRSALKNGTLEWMEQLEKLSNRKPSGQNSLLGTEPAQSVVQRITPEILKREDGEKLAERSKLLNQDIVNWVTSKLAHNMQEISKSKDQIGLANMDSRPWLKVSVAAENDRNESQAQKGVSELDVLTAEHKTPGEITEGRSIGCYD